jgi:disulfide bond formation protein DsbB
MFATFGSLYYSVVEHFAPCTLCWYQRISVYPLAIILGIATYRRDKAVIPYGMALSGVGLFFALYQILEMYVPGLAVINFCGATGADCKNEYVRYLGFINIPLMSVVAFALILFFLQCAKRGPERREN